MTENRTRSTPYRAQRVVDGTTIVTLHGEIDILTAAPLSAGLDDLTAGPRPDLLLDLRPVSFIDCAGLGVLCRARNRAQAQNGRLRLVTDSAHVRRILRRTGLTSLFAIHPQWPEDVARALDTELADLPGS